MKKTLLLLALIIGMTSCYKDDATFTVEISGYSDQYKISYRDDNGWNENVTVTKGFCYYNNYTSDWKLDLIVEAPDSIFVTILKRGDYFEIIKGKDLLEVHKTIKH